MSVVLIGSAAMPVSVPVVLVPRVCFPCVLLSTGAQEYGKHSRKHDEYGTRCYCVSLCISVLPLSHIPMISYIGSRYSGNNAILD